MKKTGLLIGLAVVGLGSLCSCRQTDVYNEFNTLPRNGWFKRDVQRFTPESPDSTGRYDLYLTLRHNGDYAYRNLWLFVSYTGADGVQKTDTVNCELADESGAPITSRNSCSTIVFVSWVRSRWLPFSKPCATIAFAVSPMWAFALPLTPSREKAPVRVHLWKDCDI